MRSPRSVVSGPRPSRKAAPAYNSAPRQVAALAPGVGGCWLVETQGSTHVWDLDAMTYTRSPGPRSRSGSFDYDNQPMPITCVERWPRVGSTSLVYLVDPHEPDRTEHWRLSSQIVSISEIACPPNS